MSTSIDFRPLIDGLRGRRGLPPLLEALGLETALDPVPGSAWSAYGLAGAPDIGALLVVGRAGSLDALLVEMTTAPEPERIAWLARRVRSRNPARLHLYLIAAPGYDTLTIATFGLDDAFHHIALGPGRTRNSDLEALDDMAPRNGESGLALAIRQARALDRSQVTRRFFRDFRLRRAAVAEAWTGLPGEAERERLQLSLLFLSRLTFLYFLQRRRALAGDDRYLLGLFGKWRRESSSRTDAAHGQEERSFYRARLLPLFFAALNRKAEARDKAARELGDLPYLNGGLFERHALERRFPELDLGDAAVAACFDDLMERYRFTAREGSEGGYGIDPEILGRVFEGLMAPDQRGDTGSFYTPAPVVNRVVREAMATYIAGVCSPEDARTVLEGRGGTLPEPARCRVRRRLEKVRVLDPACGSGAFLLGALQRLASSLSDLSDQPRGKVRRRVVATSLHGVDLLDEAALLCSLRLWLALSADDHEVRPLPNLDRRIRQGDALVDPLDLGALDTGGAGEAPWHPLSDPDVRRTLRAVEPAARRYLDSSPEARVALRGHLQRVEARLARRWLDGAHRAQQERLRGLRARAADRDLFGQVPDTARKAAAAVGRAEDRLQELRAIATQLEEREALPFFSFGVHFVDAGEGFDLILSNPPWVRSHRWPERIRRLSSRYEVCRDAAWSRAAELTGAPGGAGAQVDLSLLFIERAVRLLAPGGVLAVLLPAKALRALYGGAARRMLLRDLEFALIEDHSLDPRSIFRADAFAAVFVARKPVGGASAEQGPKGVGGESAKERPNDVCGATAGGAHLRVRLTRRSTVALEYRVRQRELPLFPDDPSSPWIMAPPDVLSVIRKMQNAGPPLGGHPELRVRRGVMTGANEVLLFSAVEPKLGGLAVVEAEGFARSRRQGRPAGECGVYRGVVELSGLRPLVRGADVDAFRYRTEGFTTWCHDGEGGPAAAPPRLARYLEAHRERLAGRTGWRPGLPLGAVFRLSADTLGSKVAWHDLSDTLRAVALPAKITVEGVERELIPLNTVYFLPTPHHEAAVLLAGLLNSLPVRTMARAIAERAKDARFRFFAWTISSLPLPHRWADSVPAREILSISRAAHRDGGMAPSASRQLDLAAARLYGLGELELEPLHRFDQWLKGAG